jgi:ubiquinone/menaquinone biosynthesis C-methylase UbiE
MHDMNKVALANIEVHTAAADKYNTSEPHYRPENIARVRAIIKELKSTTGGTHLLDIGCGTGFIIDIAKDYFTSIRGIDITPAMLEKVSMKSSACDIKLQIAQSDNIPFDDEAFDVCTAHAVLHHLHDLFPTMKEVFRVLKKGGCFYSDLDPNAYFWEALSTLSPDRKYCQAIEREIAAVCHKDEELSKEFHLSKESIQNAEPLKHLEGGFKEETLQAMMKSIGFSNCEIIYEWFIGEAGIIHGEQTKSCASVLRSYLHEFVPLTRCLFKYISIRARK